MEQLVRETAERTGRIDYFFNNALVGLSTSLRAEAAKFGIGFSVICPGLVCTVIFADGKGEYGKILEDWSVKQQDHLLHMAEKLKSMDVNVFAQKMYLKWHYTVQGAEKYQVGHEEGCDHGQEIGGLIG